MASTVSLPKSARGILVGANGTGKSTLAAHVLTEFRKDYPQSRMLVLDTKPRWRAEWLPDGTYAKRQYRKMAKGDTIAGSVSMSRMTDWPLAWHPDTNPSHTVIAQRMHGTQAENVRYQIKAAERFFETQDARSPSLLYIDEGMDFFSANGSARGSDIVQRCFRAGREKGLATMIGVQRPISINLQCLTETSWCAVFRINYAGDIKRLYEMGWPQTVGPPTYEQDHCFRLWREGRNEAPLYKLNLGKAA